MAADIEVLGVRVMERAATIAALTQLLEAIEREDEKQSTAAIITLASGLLIDLGRIADALEQIAMNTNPRPLV
jgi:hypothetical protein